MFWIAFVIIFLIPGYLVWYRYRQAVLAMTANWPIWKALCLMVVGAPVYMVVGVLCEHAIWLAPIAGLGTATMLIGWLTIVGRILSTIERLKGRI